MVTVKKIPIGRDNFKDIIEKGYYYVDKTKIIEDILEIGAYVTLFPRPRRFGKSLMISTMDEFFNAEKKEENKNLFKGLYIDKSKYKNEQGKYPIIKLNLKSVEASNWEETYSGIKEIIRQLYESKRYVMEILNEEEKELYRQFLTEQADLSKYKQSLKILSEYLYRYYNEKVIILIDEYDVPIQKGYLKGFYTQIVDFIKALFNNALKTNENIEFAIMTGVLRVSKESIFSDLNNVKIYSTVNTAYDEYFGFTEEETKKLLEYYNLELTPEVKQMYNGYIFGNQQIYNPWSIINYASDKTLLPYWINTSGNELLQQIFDKTQEETKEMIEKLVLGESIACKYNDKVTFLDLNNIETDEAKDTVANFLLVSGYLTKTKESNLVEQDGYLTLKIPNQDVRTTYKDVIAKWIGRQGKVSSQKIYELHQALISNDKIKIEKILNETLNYMSFYDSQENFYHGYMLGLFVRFLNSKYIVKSNREAGRGRFDIMIESVDRKIGIVVEFKVAGENEDIEEKAKIGKEQIVDKEYYKELELDRVENILTYAVAFKGKECKVR